MSVAASFLGGRLDGDGFVEFVFGGLVVASSQPSHRSGLRRFGAVI